MKRITAILSLLAIIAALALPGAAFAGNKFTPVNVATEQPVCPQATGAANASPVALSTGNAPLICGTSLAS